MLELIIYFLVGCVLDIIITAYYQNIIKKHAFSSAFLSFTITLANLFVFSRIILGGGFWQQTIAFALGCALGTWLTVRFENNNFSKFIFKK